MDKDKGVYVCVVSVCVMCVCVCRECAACVCVRSECLCVRVCLCSAHARVCSERVCVCVVSLYVVSAVITLIIDKVNEKLQH